MNCSKIAWAGCCLLLVVASSARGQIGDYVVGDILDQKFEENFSDPRYLNVTAYAPVNAYQEFAQSFTVGRNGMLSHVEVFGGRSGYTDITLSIYSVVDGNIGPLLGSRTRPGQSASKVWMSFDLRGAGIQVHQGDQLAIAVASDFGWIANLWGDPLLTYDGGYVYHRLIQETGGQHTIPIGQWYRLDDPYYARNDLIFRTFVIPEPSTLALVVIASAVLSTRRGWHRRLAASG